MGEVHPSNLARAASLARRRVEEMETAPEGIELYRWLWVPRGYRHGWNVMVQEPVKVTACEDIPASIPLPPTVCVFWTVMIADLPIYHPDCRVAYVGWNREVRTAVIFYADGGPTPERIRVPEAVSDEGMAALASSGNEVRAREGRQAIRRYLKKFRERDDLPPDAREKLDNLLDRGRADGADDDGT